MSWFTDLFGGSSSSGVGGGSDPDLTNPFNYSDAPAGGGFGNSYTDPGSIFGDNMSGFGGSPQQHSDNASGTPGFGNSSFDFGDTFGFMPSSMTDSSPSPSLITQPNNLGGVANFTTGMDMPAGSQSSAISGGAAYPSGDGVSPKVDMQGPQTNKPADSILDMLGLGTGNSGLDGKLFGAGVSGLGLAANLAMSGGMGDAQGKLNSLAGQQNAQGQQLQSYLANGTLPPGAQQWVNQQTEAQKAAIRAKHAQTGTTGSSMEVQELNQVEQAATAQMFTLASKLLETGITQTNSSGQLYNYLMQQENQDNKEVSDAISNFVSSLAGGGSRGQSITLKAQ